MGLGHRKFIANIHEKYKRRKEGKFNCIPFYEDFPRLSKIIPGVIKGCNYLITANAGVGKSKFARALFIRTPYEFIKRHPDSGIKLKIMYFTFEESKEEVFQTLVCNKLYRDHKISISPGDLESFGKKLMSQDVLDKIDGCISYFDDLSKYLEVIDGIDNPTGIYKHCREYSQKNGTHWFYNKDKPTDKITIDQYDALSKVQKPQYWYSHYEPNDPEEYVIIIADHISLLKQEKGFDGKMLSHHETLTKWSADYCRKQMTRHWKYIVVNVQQQVGSGEDVNHFKHNKLEPSLDKLADNKYTQRDALIAFGLFAPFRHRISKYGGGYNIDVLKDSYLSAKVLKNRKGRTGPSIPLYFDGMTEIFEELPRHSDKTGLEKYYNLVKRIETERS